MTLIIITIIVAFIGGVVSVFMSDEMLNGLYDIAFRADDCMRDYTGVDFFASISDIAYGIGISLIILKFLKKGFDIYVLWTDGDPDADPVLLLTNFVKAIATALVFQWLYNVFIDICDDITTTITSTISDTMNSTTAWVNGLASVGLVPALSGLIFIIFYLILLFSMMGRGIEMLVLEAGVPLACVGLLDNDKGVWRSYVNQFVKAFITTIVQIMLCKIGISLMVSAPAVVDATNTLWGIGCMLAAISMPKILREFLVPTGGNGQVGNTVFQTVRIASMAHNIFR